MEIRVQPGPDGRPINTAHQDNLTVNNLTIFNRKRCLYCDGELKGRKLLFGFKPKDDAQHDIDVLYCTKCGYAQLQVNKK